LIGTLPKVLLNMLSYTYNYYRNFNGIIAYDEKTGTPSNDITKLKDKFNGQKPEEVITNLFKE